MSERPPRKAKEDMRSQLEKLGPIRASRDLGEPPAPAEQRDAEPLELTERLPELDSSQPIQEKAASIDTSEAAPRGEKPSTLDLSIYDTKLELMDKKDNHPNFDTLYAAVSENLEAWKAYARESGVSLEDSDAGTYILGNKNRILALMSSPADLIGDDLNAFQARDRLKRVMSAFNVNIEKKIAEAPRTPPKAPVASLEAVTVSGVEPIESIPLAQERTFAENRKDMAAAVQQIESLGDLSPAETEKPREESVQDQQPEQRRFVPSAEQTVLDTLEAPTTPIERIKMTLEERGARLAEEAGMGQERIAAQEALAARRPALKAFLEAEAAFKKTKKPSAEQQAEMDAARAAYHAVDQGYRDANLAYVGKMQNSVQERLLEKLRKDDDRTPGEKHFDEGEERITRLMQRYNQRYRIKEVVLPSKDQEHEVREELLDEKGRNIFQKMQKWNAGATKWLEGKSMNLVRSTSWGKGLNDVQAERYARHTARAARVLGFATVGTVAGLGASLFGGPAAASVLLATGGRLGMSALGIGTGMLVGTGAGKVFMETKGKRREAAFNEMQGKNIASAEDLEAQLDVHGKGSKEALTKARIMRENIWSAVGGFSVTGGPALAENGLSAVRHAWHTLSGQQPNDAAALTKAGSGALKNVAGAKAPNGTLPNVAGGNPPVGTPLGSASAEKFLPDESLKIDGKINNADRLFGHFRDSLEAKYHPDSKELPAALKKFYSLGASQDQLTKALNYQTNELSAMMHKGDTLSFEHNALVMHFADGRVHEVIDAKGIVHPFDVTKMPTTGVPHQEVAATVPHESAPTAGAAATPEQASSAAVTGSESPERAGVPASAASRESSYLATPGASAPVQEAASASAPHPLASVAESSPRGTQGYTTLGDFVGSPQVPHETLPLDVNGSANMAPVGESPTTLGDVVRNGGAGTEVAPPAAEIAGIQVNPAIATPYEWSIPGTGERQPFAFGGSEAQSSGIARAYAASHPGSSMFFTTQKGGFFGVGSRTVVSGWRSMPDGKLSKIPEVMDRFGRPMRPPAPGEFVEVIK